MADTLKPCPCCGEKATVKNGSLQGLHYAGCKGCKLQTAFFTTKAEAIAAWNRRPEPAADAVEAVARALAPYLEGYAEYDHMPRNKAELREAVHEGRYTDINLATQGDADDAARALLAAILRAKMAV